MCSLALVPGLLPLCYPVCVSIGAKTGGCMEGTVVCSLLAFMPAI
jgi:hypothetical protein